MNFKYNYWLHLVMSAGYTLALWVGTLNIQVSAQYDSIQVRGVWRSFIVHLPRNYQPNVKYPLVMQFHGLQSNAAQQEIYSGFDFVADSFQFVVVYPNAVNGQWNIAGDEDVLFIETLTEVLKQRYAINNCLFFSGISDGGFFTYKLACAYTGHIDGIAVVAGNMTKFLQSSCSGASQIPLLHFHGTADAIVAYKGVSPLIPPVDSTISWWRIHNGCQDDSVVTEIPDIDAADHCTALHIKFSCTGNASSVIFYRIDNGGHTWPGSIPVPPLGNTCQDIRASSIMAHFFSALCISKTSSQDDISNDELQAEIIQGGEGYLLHCHREVKEISIFDLSGRLLMHTDVTHNNTIDIRSIHGLCILSLRGHRQYRIQKLFIP
ncbi:MAG: hypothetical protein K1X68_08155 [Saprospiraceae bacterium]|nr:hypothetical protein [Saprospiraceae bacterium]HMX89225.1 hypothetical protein [Saprospiraceae bacterium]HNF11842.1 hypothetical protein [Saprospiraceae bacterium]HNI79931.1 hypothetical protein [Saprospiraceae bacterium]HNL19886.1 hypothetical protein [Saprospiraceae bacterium]